MSKTKPRIEVRDDPEKGAYVVEVDGEQAGEAVYHMRQGRHIFTHTEIDDRFSGMGLGTSLVRHALDEVRSRGGSVVPICPFFAAFISRHLEYEDLVDKEMYERLRKSRKRASDVDDETG